MRTLGLIGGISWQSTLLYYRYLNEATARILGPDHSCRHVLYTVDFAEVQRRQAAGAWDDLHVIMAEVAAKLKAAGAEAVVICANTMHLSAPAITEHTGLPVLHIADAAAEAVRAAGLTRVGLLGTRYTMEGDFYRARMTERYGLEVMIPPPDDRTVVHDVIYGELTHGVVAESSREAYRGVVERLAAGGAEGVVLACTEIPLLIGPTDVDVPVFDTTRLHAEAGVAWATAAEAAAA